MNNHYEFSINSPFWQSLVYQLEKTFPSLTFEYFPEKKVITCVGVISEEIKIDINKRIDSFREKMARMSNRVTVKQKWSLVDKLSSNNYTSDLTNSLEGTIYLEQDFCESLALIDQIFESFSLELGKKNFCSSMISENDLTKCGYLPEKKDQVNFVKTEGSKRTCCLTPAACLPLYPSKQNHDFNDSQSYTFQNKVYRVENFVFNKRFLERNLEYPIREYVFFYSNDKDRERVFESYSKIMNDFSKFFNLSSSLESAHDVFFSLENTAVAIHQMLFDKKYEVLVKRSYGDIAISSINFHEDYFSQKFNIMIQGEICHSLCIGWGLGRILKVCLDSHDYNIMNLKNKLEQYLKRA